MWNKKRLKIYYYFADTTSSIQLFITFEIPKLIFMKIISYNVNGIRAAITKGFLEWLQQADPDVICLQEIKANEDQIPTEAIAEAGYPFQYYFSAEKRI